MHSFLHVPAMIKCSKMKRKDESNDNTPSKIPGNGRCHQSGAFSISRTNEKEGRKLHQNASKNLSISLRVCVCVLLLLLLLTRKLGCSKTLKSV